MTNDSEQPSGTGGAGTEAPTKSGATDSPRARLTRLKINRFRQVKPGTELRFDHGINVLLGRNGTGKTTLLELVCAVASGDLKAYQAESFELEFEMQLSRDRIFISARNVLAPQERRPPLGAPVDADIPEFSWSYSLRFERSDGTQYLIEAEEGRTRLRHGSGPPTPLPAAPLFVANFHERVISLALKVEDLNFPAHRVLQRLLANNCIRLDEGLDLFRATVGGLALPRLGRSFAATLFSGFPWGNSRSSVQSFIELFSTYLPSSLLECLLAVGEEAHRSASISISSAQWAVLGEIEQILGVDLVQMTFQFIERKDLEGGTQSIFGKPVFQVTHRGTTFTHDKLSYGEKRLLAFMYHAAANPQILVADELVNGLHHGWIQACLDAIQGQAFLTSQNPLLLDHLPFASAEEVQRRFILCDRDEHGDWIWRNMDEDAAGAFYRAYKVGIQHVSEILETKGLW
jgi:ABC-type lipoprotein export system ATPase subunit